MARRHHAQARADMTISSSQIAELLKREGETPVILLCTITHPTPDTLLLCDNRPGQDIVSRGDTFVATWLSIDLATDTLELPEMTFQMPNIEREVGYSLQNLTGEPIRVTVECILENDPDNPFVRFPLFDLVDVTIDSISVSGTLRQARLQAEPWGRRVTPRYHHALFR